MRELVLVHGRAQEHKDAVALKKEWLDTLAEGLAKSELTLPIPEAKVRLPFYGDTLFGLVSDVPPDQVAEVIVKGNRDDPALREFVDAVLDEVATRHSVTEEEIEEEAQKAIIEKGGTAGVVERGPLNWGWVQGILRAIDKHVPGASGASIALVTRDVYQYLSNPGVRDTIDTGVRKALANGADSVVVAHSLGTVVAYNLLRREGTAAGWRVPLLLTVGSPLAVKRIRTALRPTRHPECVGKWYNALDSNDVVALYPLDRAHFPLDPEIENQADVKNQTDNQHGIKGYLNDKKVAKRIYDALVAP